MLLEHLRNFGAYRHIVEVVQLVLRNFFAYGFLILQKVGESDGVSKRLQLYLLAALNLGLREDLALFLTLGDVGLKLPDLVDRGLLQFPERGLLSLIFAEGFS